MRVRISRNMSDLDRLLRVTAALVLIYISYFSEQLISNAIISLLLGLLGLLNLAAAITAFCPLYRLADIDTRKNKNNSP